jgi:hypothetical protein
VGPLEVVGIHEQPDSAGQIREVGKHRARQQLLPQRSPESFDLPQRLRVLRPTLDVDDPFTPELLLELRRAAPSGVLPTVIGEDLSRRAKGRDALVQRLHDQRGLLVMRYGMRH